jgi:hypothetical protein
MLEITERARELLVRMASDAELTATLAARIVLAQKGFSICLDTATSDDDTFSDNGRTILALDREASRTLAGRTLDVQDSGNGIELVLR